MDPSLLLTLAQALLQLLDSSIITDIESVWGFRFQLRKLKDTMKTITAVLRDAEELERQQVQMSNFDRDWLEKLRDAVYEADDLFDKVAFIAQRKSVMAGSKLSEEVSLFFSCFNQLAFGFNTSREVRRIRERLDDISKDRRDFGSASLGSAGKKIETRRRDDSHSFVDVEDVIGRDQDKKAVIEMLLDSSGPEDVKFVTIFGVGGLGKTTLAQLVYNDRRIDREFPQMKLWVCVSHEFDIRILLCKILKSATTRFHDDLEMDQLQRLFQEVVIGKKFLLVLDDVWNEDRDQWLKLMDLLVRGVKGSRILVTTRSEKVARIVGNGQRYRLKGLSEKNSWHLFVKMAFEDEEEKKDVDLIEIGKQILEKCANVPLAIRVVGSLLYGQARSTWQSFQNIGLASMKQDNTNGILPVLKLSYHHLAWPLKSCFSYCAVFPKDYRIEKEMLINLWMAQSFIVPLEGQGFEEAAEEYFMTLLQRCFFQDVERDDYGHIMSCKLHDLMHDVAQEVAGMDILVVHNVVSKLRVRTRHISFGDLGVQGIINSLSEMDSVRTFFRWGPIGSLDNGDPRILLSKARYLRVLCLCDMSITNLPSSIGKLVHLRYLDLSYNRKLQFLPATLCKLINLQTLNLKGCLKLKELPKGLRRLVNLRHMDIFGCRSLTHMPPGMSNLACLHSLPKFVVRYGSNPAHEGQLEDLEALTNLRGSLEIVVRGYVSCDVPEIKEVSRVCARKKEGRCVRAMVHLKDIKISFHGNTGSKALPEGLHPPPNLRNFKLSGYGAATFPNWESLGDWGTSVPSLVNFSVLNCSRLQHLPLLSRLRLLKTLELCRLYSLEYIESGAGGVATNMVPFSGAATWSRSLSADDRSAFFPSLEKLVLKDLPKLKGWGRPTSEMVDLSSGQGRLLLSFAPYLFPRLSDLTITGCPNLTCIPLSSNFKQLTLQGESDSSCSPSLLKSWSYNFRHVLIINLLNDLKSLSTVELLRSDLSSSLHSLCIKKLSVLEDLNLCGLDDVVEVKHDSHCHNHMPWNSFSGNLRSLELWGLPKLVHLPQGIQYLTDLQSLRIIQCDSLEILPEWFSCLTSLQSLYIHQCTGLKCLPQAMSNLASLTELQLIGCPRLMERCQEPTGEDWPIIRHIPSVYIY